MAQLFTTTDLIASIKARGMIPTSQTTFQNVDFLRFATEEVQVGMLPMLLSVREEYFVTYEDQSVTVDKQFYTIPDRAVGRSLRDVIYSNSNPITLRSEIDSLARLEPEQLHWQQNVARSTNDYMYFLRDDAVGLSPAPRQSTGTLRLFYHRRPSELVEVTAAAKVVSIDSATQVTVDAVPTGMDSSSVVDIVTAKGGFVSLGDDLTLTSVATPTIDFTNALPSGLRVGDYIAQAGFSPIPQIPLELQPVLAQRVVVKCLEALGDQGGVQVAQAKLNEIEEAAFKLITPRERGTPRKIFAINYYKNSYWG